VYTNEKLLQMLSSKKVSVRYDACEWIRVSQESSPEIVNALQKATHDDDKEVAERATYALQADVHHQMAIKMGIIKPDVIIKEGNIQQKLYTEEDFLYKAVEDRLYPLEEMFDILFDIGDKLATSLHSLFDEPIGSIYFRRKHRKEYKESLLHIPCPICGEYHKENNCPNISEKESITNHKYIILVIQISHRIRLMWQAWSCREIMPQYMENVVSGLGE
jgi:hypothetical protein